jgi:threonine/homoserine/homoserine lactone efflux protein
MVSSAMLDSAVLPVFLLAVLALAVAPGPDLALIVSHALARGARAGMWCSVGIALAGFLQTAVVAFGVGHLMQRMPVIADAVRFVGAAYLLWIGIGLLRKARRTGEMAPAAPRAIDRERPRGWVWRGLLNNLLNPKALLFFSLFLPQFATAPAEEVPLQIALLGGILTITVMAVNVGVAWGAGSVRRAFNLSDSFDRVASSILGLVFVGLALRMVFQEVRAR